jgi:hypothetical protein
MRTASYLLLSLLICSFSLTSNPKLIHRLIVLPDSKLEIKGHTNVTSYKCSISRYVGNDTLVLHEEGHNIRPVFVKGTVTLDATSFDCGMALMTSDFRKTIDSKTYPDIVIDFISFERAPNYNKGEEKFKGIVKISLAGVTKLFEMDCLIEAKPSGLIHLMGGREFTFEDFSLDPPKRMLGIVKVDKRLNVSFHLVLKLDADS